MDQQAIQKTTASERRTESVLKIFYLLSLIISKMKGSALKMYEVTLVMMTCVVCGVLSHGRMVEPPQRSSMWRFGFDIPANFNDNENNCGGMAVCMRITNDIYVLFIIL